MQRKKQSDMKNKVTAFIVLILISCLPLNAVTKRALLVGISDYPLDKTHSNVSWSPIHGSNDAQILGKTLHSHGFKGTRLTNSRATASRIRKALNKLQSDAREGDIIYLHFSCHGQPVEDMDGDEADGWDEAIIPYDAWKSPILGLYNGENHILDDELNTIIGLLRERVGSKGFVYVVLDACHSGESYRGESNEEKGLIVRGTDIGFSPSNKLFMPAIDARSNIPIESVSGWAEACMLEACRAYQSNYEIKQEGKYYGPLSYYINRTLQSHQLTPDTEWTKIVAGLMNADPCLSRQNMVIQTTTRP